MDLYTALRTLLINNAPVTALVTTGGISRVYRSWQQGYASPAIILQNDGDDPQNDLGGHSGLTISEVVVTCRHDASATADSLKAAVVGLLAGYAGAFNLVIDNVASSVVPKEEGSDAHWYDWTIRTTILVSEAI